MCKKLIYLIPFVMVIGLAAGVASGDVLVLLDFEGTDTWTDNWDDVQVTETSDAPEGSTTASTWEIPGDSGSPGKLSSAGGAAADIASGAATRAPGPSIVASRLSSMGLRPRFRGAALFLLTAGAELRG